MKILLINLPFRASEHYKKGYFHSGKQSPIFPLGLAYIAKHLEKNGFPEIEILDIYAEQLYYDDVLARLRESHFDIVGISGLVTQYQYLKWITTEIKKINPQSKIVLGNGLATVCDKIILEHVKEVDVCVRGEGEITFLELLQKNFNSLESINGISFRQNGEFKRNQDQRPIPDIDVLGMPAYHLLKMPLYLKTKFYNTGVSSLRDVKKYKETRIAGVISARGCPYNCNFCGKVIPSCRLRSVEKIIKEIKFLIKNFQISGVHFIDELFVVNKERTKELCRELAKLNIPWDCQGRVNLVDEEILRIMKDAGCLAIGFGIESGDAQILKNMNKQTTPEQIEKAVLAAQKAGLKIKNQLIFGYPGENRETIENTVRLMKKINDPGKGFNYIQALPGTKLYQECLEKNLILDEEAYLYMLQRGWEHGEILLNFTSFPISQLKQMHEYYSIKMQVNYFFNAITNFKRFKEMMETPRAFLKLGKLTMRHYIKILIGDYSFLFAGHKLLAKLFG